MTTNIEEMNNSYVNLESAICMPFGNIVRIPTSFEFNIITFVSNLSKRKKIHSSKISCIKRNT